MASLLYFTLLDAVEWGALEDKCVKSSTVTVA